MTPPDDVVPPPGDPLRTLPSVDVLLARPRLLTAAVVHGRSVVLATIREVLAQLRAATLQGAALPGDRDRVSQTVEERAVALLEERSLRPLRRVLNLTGTVLHTNLGRAPLAQVAIEAMCEAAGAVNVEFDLAAGRRGERDAAISAALCRLTGAESALAVNNNAAAVLLALHGLARNREVIVSRGELVEIGGSFRLPDIMARAGCRLVEVGTTNRTHRHDYEAAIGPRTAAIMKVHPSNFSIEGFSSSVSVAELAPLAHAARIPLIADLGSGSLVDLTRFGLPREPMPAELLSAGVDLVTFSGDKLLGGPQCGLIAGRHDLVQRLQKNPLRRALRLDKLILAALGATLWLYEDEQRLLTGLPTLRLLARTSDEIRACAERITAAVQDRLAGVVDVTVAACRSQIGSGSLPVDRLDSWALVLRPLRTSGRRSFRVASLARAFRTLPVPVIGRIHDEALWLDLRCLENEAEFVGQLGHLDLGGGG